MASLTFNIGDTEKTFSFAATSDTIDDDGESVKFVLETLPTGVSEGTNKQTVVSITDDDVPQVTVNFGAATYSVDEGDDTSITETAENEVTITVTFSADPEMVVTVPIEKANDDGAANTDYSGVPENVACASGNTSKTFEFSATTDTTDDDGDVPAVTVSYGASIYSVAVSGTFSVKVKLSADPGRTVEVPITATNRDGASSADYSGAPRRSRSTPETGRGRSPSPPPATRRTMTGNRSAPKRRPSSGRGGPRWTRWRCCATLGKPNWLWRPWCPQNSGPPPEAKAWNGFWPGCLTGGWRNKSTLNGNRECNRPELGKRGRTRLKECGAKCWAGCRRIPAPVRWRGWIGCKPTSRTVSARRSCEPCSGGCKSGETSW